ncbi:MAG: hypothetical protein A3H57_03460 [Candidatus Taylorbacteria bacterium RIFCSPLOWO2_02_FULL_43_11]|nr:MAG: hypothetical protein A3H57_03460 [Candidatus Taylorbacteria bacterium RIFCSPLOWO2_02_FULL_43_11]
MKTKKHRLRDTCLASAVMLPIVAGAVILLLPNRQIETIPGALPNYGIPSSYSEEEMRDFWLTKYWGNISALFEKRSKISEIQGRFSALVENVSAQYGTNIVLNMVTTYVAESTLVLAGAWVTNGGPQIDIIVPRLIDIHATFEKADIADWEQILQREMAISVMHEMDHLVLQKDDGFSRQNPAPLDILVEQECAAWANTCEFAIRPILEKGLRLTDITRDTYFVWVQANRNRGSPRWKEYIRSLYKHTRKTGA